MKVLIVAGGTGGHLYPGIAVARALQDHEVLFVVRRHDLGRDVLLKEGFSVKEISGQGLPRALSLRLLTFPFKFLQGWFETWRLLKQFHPDRVLGMGGYLSVPVIATAHWMGFRTLVHEQNVFPGLANRLLSRWADSVAVSFPSSGEYFKTKPVWVSGLPIRPEIKEIDQAAARKSFGLFQDMTTFLIFGGSLGAKHLNTIVTEAWPLLAATGLKFQVLHITGTKNFERVESLYKKLQVSAKVLPYCHSMAEAYSAADAVVCRSGASTVAELLELKRPALLVPYPHASNNHQLYNAQVLEKAGFARVVLDADLTPSVVSEFLAKVSSFREVHSAPDVNHHDAADRLAEYLVRS